ncbi:MAG: hypothetical protein QOF48_3254 [Verrucomicrobiota bacterium]|jgi:hypothetical protein
MECLAVMLLVDRAALFHLDKHGRFPDEISEARAAAVMFNFSDAVFGLAAHVDHAGMAAGLEQPVEEDLGLAFRGRGDLSRNQRCRDSAGIMRNSECPN